MKFKRGQFTHDNMGPEYEILFPLFFGFYLVRTIATNRRSIMHERHL